MTQGILLLEDNQEEATLIESILDELGYIVYHSYNGQDLLDTFKDTEGVNFIAAVLDMRISNTKAEQTPESHHLGEKKENLRGIAAAKALREYTNIPIVFASAYAPGEQEKEIRRAGLKGVHTFFAKEDIYLTPNVLLRSLDMAIQAVEAQEEEELPADIIFPEAGVIVFTGIMSELIVGKEQLKVKTTRIFRKEDILMCQMENGTHVRVTLINGEEFLKSCRRPRFVAAYKAMKEQYPKQNFLVQGPAHGGTAWINREQIVGYNSRRIFFKNQTAINIADGMYTTLKMAFPSW